MVRVRAVAATARVVCAGLGLAFAMAPWSQPWAAEAPAAGKAAVAPAVADAAAANLDNGRTVFENSGCGTCHTLKAAGAAGSVGPAFDGDTDLSVPFVVDRVTNGQGAMPSFSGQLTDKEIADVAAYIVQAATK